MTQFADLTNTNCTDIMLQFLQLDIAGVHVGD